MNNSAAMIAAILAGWILLGLTWLGWNPLTRKPPSINLKRTAPRNRRDRTCPYWARCPHCRACRGMGAEEREDG